MKRASQLKIEYAIVCDDVRIEASNKVILIGVYGGSILLESFEAPIRLLPWFIGVAPKAGEFPVQLRLLVLDESGKAMSKSVGKIDVKAGSDDLTVGFGGGVILKFSGPGKLVVQTRQSEKTHWKTITEKRIALANVQQQPS
jgi:hypothetical protein